MLAVKSADAGGRVGFVRLDLGADIDRRDGVAAGDHIFRRPEIGAGFSRRIGVGDRAMIEQQENWNRALPFVRNDQREVKRKSLTAQREANGNLLARRLAFHRRRIGVLDVIGKVLRLRRRNAKHLASEYLQQLAPAPTLPNVARRDLAAVG